MGKHQEGDFEQGVMVDVGPGTGAVVIYTADALRSQEIEISPVGHDAQRVHTDVLRRRTADGYLCAAVFGSIAEGDYQLWQREPARIGDGARVGRPGDRG